MNFRTFHFLPLLALLYGLPTAAATVYKSVDENGVVTYSDTRPAQDIGVETMIIDVDAPELTEQEQQQRLVDMRETTDRMAADRMAREKHRAEMREIQAQTAAQQAPYPEYYDSPTIYSGYYDTPVRRPWRHPGYLRPEHPMPRPPLRPPGHNVRPLPDNNFPAPHIRPLFTPTVRGGPR
jgi:hypothetical protein